MSQTDTIYSSGLYQYKHSYLHHLIIIDGKCCEPLSGLSFSYISCLQHSAFGLFENKAITAGWNTEHELMAQWGFLCYDFFIKKK